MAATLLETANTYFDNEFIQQKAVTLEENEAGVGKALYTAIPIVLSGIVSQVRGGNYRLAGQLLNQTLSVSGENLLDQLFGKQLGEVTRSVIHYSGIKSISAYNILAAAAPAVVTTVSRYALDQQLDETALADFLTRQQTVLAGTLPAGFPTIVVVPDTPHTIATSYTAPASAPIETPEPEETYPSPAATLLPEEAETEEQAPEEIAPPRKRRKHWITLTAVTAGALIAWYLFKGNCNSGH